MLANYADDVVFNDPAFGMQHGGVQHAGHANRTRTALSFTLSDIDATDATAPARWVARYRFRQNGRLQINAIDAR